MAKNKKKRFKKTKNKEPQPVKTKTGYPPEIDLRVRRCRRRLKALLAEFNCAIGTDIKYDRATKTLEPIWGLMPLADDDDDDDLDDDEPVDPFAGKGKEAPKPKPEKESKEDSAPAPDEKTEDLTGDEEVDLQPTPETPEPVRG